ncbi:MAG: TonB-dependent receptor, partial [Caldithrix sp.]
MKVGNAKFILPTLKSLCVFLIILFFICGIHNNSFSQGTGTITGTVTDADTGLPLPGVNVQLRHTVLGTSTSLEGEFSLSRIEAGSYSVMASMIGYTIQTIDNVAILPGSPAKLDFKLAMSFVEVDAVVVTASRKAKSLSETPNSISIISAMDIRKR